MIAGVTPRAGRWELARGRSAASFAVRNFGVATVRGQVPVTAAWVDVEPPGRPGAVHAELDLAAICTGSQRRDRDLRTPRLLDTARHPGLTFDGTAAGPIVDGVLAGRTTTRVRLDVAALTNGDDGAVTVRATTTLDRADLGVRAPRFLIGRRIAVVIEVTLAPPPVPPGKRTDAAQGQAGRDALSVSAAAGARR